MKSRERSIDNAQGGTCAWLLHTDRYIAWRTSPPAEWQHGLLWIKGNAGAGKSTLMKFAVEHAKRRHKDELILPHFFNARGSQLEHSTEGMYRTLLVWLLETLPTEKLDLLEREFDNGNSPVWPVPELVRLLKAAMEGLRGVAATFYIDALDECGDNEVRDMLKVFRNLVKNAWGSAEQVRVCFASRPYPQISFPDALYIDFKYQEEHVRDIQRYIEDELQIGNSALAQSVRDEVQRKAAGSFMWTVLVVQLLQKDCDDGQMQKLRTRLDGIPEGLHALYSYTLKRYPEDRHAMLACFRFLLFSKKPLWSSDLWWATRWSEKRDACATQEAYRELSVEEMERYIVSVTKGLVEFRGRPQFLHESVRDFIYAPDQLQHLYGAANRDDFEGQSHEAIKDCCTAVLAAHGQRLQKLVEKFGHKIPLNDLFVTEEDPGVPFLLLHYAAEHVMQHADAAQRHGLDQTVFLDTFAQHWGSHFLSPFHLTGEFDEVEIYDKLITVLLEDDCGSLIRHTQAEAARQSRRSGKAFGLDEGDSWNWVDNRDAVAALMDLYLDLEDRHPKLQDILRRLAEGHEYVDREGYEQQFTLMQVEADDPLLGAFFLLVLAPPRILEPHLDTLSNILDGDTSGDSDANASDMDDDERQNSQFSQFLGILHFYIEHGLPSSAIDHLADADILNWTQSMRDKWADVSGREPHVAVLLEIEALIYARRGSPRSMSEQ